MSEVQCACEETCGDVPEDEDNPDAVCKGLKVECSCGGDCGCDK